MAASKEKQAAKGSSPDGLKLLRGGEELRRATAALQTGALASPPIFPPALPVDGLASSLQQATSQPFSLPESADTGLKELAAAAQRYEQAARDAPGDYDAVYNHGLALQELATRLGSSQADQLTLLSQASGRYEAAVQIRPSSHAALYNWGVALSDMARVQRAADPSAATDYLISAADKYAASLQWNPYHPQALNNWGLVLQELATSRPPAERPRLVRHSVAKFRRAMRQRPEFDRACYNLGTVFYAHACQLQHSSQQRLSSQLTQDVRAQAQEQRQEALIRHAFALAAQYIALAQVLQPGRDVYQRSLSVIQPLLPLPYLRAGYLLAVDPTAGPFHERWESYFFVLDHESFRSTPAVEAVHESSRRPGGPEENGAAADAYRIELHDIASARTCSDISLPPGHTVWVGQHSHPHGAYFVSESGGDAEGWADALALLSHLAVTNQLPALASALTPLPPRRDRKPAPA